MGAVELLHISALIIPAGARYGVGTRELPGQFRGAVENAGRGAQL
jgi:hypothetical protein